MSGMTMEATVIEVELRKGNRKKDNSEYTCYDIVDQDGVKWVAWERELAERAFNLKGQPALWQVEITQNGQYTNRTLKGIDAKVSGGFAPALQAMEASITQPFPATLTAPTVQIPGDPGIPTNTDTYIWRQVATKVAAQISTTSSEFWQNALDLVEFYRTGKSPLVTLDQIITSGAVQVGAANIAPQAQSGFPTEPPTDDEIPF